MDEETWERWGLTLLSVDKDRTLVLFSSDQELGAFTERLDKYRNGPSVGQKSAPYSHIFAAIDEIDEVRPQDRIGRLFKAEGVTELKDIQASEDYTIDVELWDLGNRQLCRHKLDEIRAYVKSRGGRVTDDYIGESLILLRARCRGVVVHELLQIDSIASVDLPPQPTLTVAKFLDLGLADLREVSAPPEGVPSIAVLDSGITSAHPMLAPAVGEATTVPRPLGDPADGHGHGTMVSGLALYGDVEACIQKRSFVPQLTLYSARVLNDQCKFSEENLITSQMAESIRYFHSTYGCRVFNVSLGDERAPYRGGKVSPWASILDTLARELDAVIVVSAGNYSYDPGEDNSADAHVQEYPHYLLNDSARIIEPATGCIVLTVGALSHTGDVPPGPLGNSVAFRPIALNGQPSPFTRSGPGLGGAIKPELCDFGGNYVYDGMMRRIRSDVRELSVISLNRDHLSSLFTTDVGTSFAAPRVAHAAARLFETFPEASANLIRALLAASASVPQPSLDLLGQLGRGSDNAVLRVCGYGQPDLEMAQASDENRVVLYAELALGFDNFHVYEVPIPEEFINSSNITRSIRVTLAFDPPVRHSRFDYLGVKMSFRLFRGKTLEQIVDFSRPRQSDEDKSGLAGTKFECQMEPGSQARKDSTLQKATFTMKRAPRTDYGDTYYLVVRCEKRWARDEHTPQRYAVVVVIAHSAKVNLYNIIRDRVRTAVRVRARQRV